ncbi:MAG: transporter substrate-binding domain-containing protein [Pseudomonadales bacterium]|nr:transporter substrate-binding domain-containing protein [Pseudomonadales bacterium]
MPALLAMILFFALSLQTVSAKDLIIGTSFSIPPYVIQESNNGIQIDIIREAFALVGHNVSIFFASNKRSLDYMLNRKIDGMNNMPPNFDDTYYSDAITDFTNVAIALKHRNITVNKIEDLSPFRVVAFQNASKYLGPVFARFAQDENANYLEVVSQQSQTFLLFSRRTDFIVMEKRIFQYYRAHGSQLLGQKATREQVRFYPLFEPSPRRIGFHDPLLRDQFNAGFRTLKESGRIQKIIETYLKPTE